MARRRRQRRLGGFVSGSRSLLIAAAVGLVLLAGSARANPFPAGQRRARVLNRSAAYGVRPELQAFLNLWEERGPFDIEIGSLPGYPGGGLRTDEAGQAKACATPTSGGGTLSNACDLYSTPHGRGAALDLWPVGFGFTPYLSWEQWTPEIRAAFETIGEFAEAAGLIWGGRWRSATFPHGDQGHVELKNWRSLPFPPPAYG